MTAKPVERYAGLHMQRAYEGLDVVVTGGSGALGTAVTRLLLEDGAHCFVPVRGTRSLEGIEFAGSPRLTLIEGIDLTAEASVSRLYQKVPRLWASIHCAGGFSMQPFAEIEMPSLQGQIGMNLLSCLLCCRQAVRAFRTIDPPRGGRIVNVTARAALEPRLGAGKVAYTLSKAAVAALTESLGEEVAGEGIWVNAVAPSIMDTPANRAAMPDADVSRWPSVEAVAQTIAFLASPRNQATRGGIIPVYGRE